MQDQSLTTSTSKTAGSFSGLSQNNFTTLWDLPQSEPDDHFRDFQVTSGGRKPIVSLLYRAAQLAKEGTLGSSFANPMELYQFHRFIGAVWIRLPEEGKQELLDAIIEIYTFYATRNRRKAATAPRIQEMQADLEDEYVRPSFPPIDTEE